MPPVSFSNQFVKPAKVVTDIPDPAAAAAPTPNEPTLPPYGSLGLDRRIKAERIECVAISDLKPNPRNAKKHPDSQIARLQENFDALGFTTPLLVDEKNQILAGHARYYAAQRGGFDRLPVVRLTHLTPAKKRALAIADN